MRIHGAFFLLLCVLGFGTTKAQDASLPRFKPCKEKLRINDPISREDRNFLRGELGDLSYTYTYTLIHHSADSLGREAIRHKNAKLARSLVSMQFPDIEMVSDSLFRGMDYMGVMDPLSYIHSKNAGIGKRRQMVDQLTVPSSNNRQLFVAVRSYMFNRSGTYIRIYIFDTDDHQLLYRDEIHYGCDIRDEKAFIKALQYGLGKLANIGG